MKHSDRIEEYLLTSRPFYSKVTIPFGSAKFIGYGTRIFNKDYKIKDTITKEDAVLLVKAKLKDIDKNLKQLIKIEITQNQYDAIVCACYDEGIHTVVATGMFYFINHRMFDRVPNLFRRLAKERRTSNISIIKI